MAYNRQILFRHLLFYLCCCWRCWHSLVALSSCSSIYSSFSHSIRMFATIIVAATKNLWKIWLLHILNIYATICCDTYTERLTEGRKFIRMNWERFNSQAAFRCYHFVLFFILLFAHCCCCCRRHYHENDARRKYENIFQSKHHKNIENEMKMSNKQNTLMWFRGQYGK